MTTNVVPLDPESPKGIALAADLNSVLGDIWLAIQARQTASRELAARPAPLRQIRRKAA